MVVVGAKRRIDERAGPRSIPPPPSESVDSTRVIGGRVAGVACAGIGEGPEGTSGSGRDMARGAKSSSSSGTGAVFIVSTTSSSLDSPSSSFSAIFCHDSCCAGSAAD